MRRFEPEPDGTVMALTDDDEVRLLLTLAGEVAELVAEPEPDDPALLRLLPNAYADDEAASAEFRRFTSAGLLERKGRNAQTVIDSLDGVEATGELRLDGPQSEAWLRWLTDIRLVLAVRLGITTDDDLDLPDEEPMVRDIYDWLGFVQNSLVEVLDA